MKPTLEWKYKRETDILARFKEMGWVPPTEIQIEGTRAGNTGGREPVGAGQDLGHREVECEPLEASRNGSSGSRSGYREAVRYFGPKTR